MTIDAKVLRDEVLPLLKEGAQVTLTVTGGSMRPLLWNMRDQVRLEKPGAVQKNDILLFCRDDGQFVLHRVRDVLPGGIYRMNGDAQGWCEIIREDEVRARVSAVCRRGRWISSDAGVLRVYNALWRPTRPLRPAVARLCSIGKRLLGGGRGNDFSKD